LETNPKLLANDLSARHLRRKLKVRKQLRSRNVPIFDFDQIVRKLAAKGSIGQTSVDALSDVKSELLNPQILDRFQVKLTIFKLKHFEKQFLQNSVQYTYLHMCMLTKIYDFKKLQISVRFESRFSVENKIAISKLVIIFGI
jgi:hypothetical protein